MEFRSQQTQTPQRQQAAAPGEVSHTSEPNSSAPHGSQGGRKLIVTIIGGVLLLVLLLVGLLFWQMKGKDSAVTAPDTGKYQALFMTNGQVYFGKLSNITSGYSELTDVYYLQVQQAVQPAAETANEDQPQVSLTKLGQELHGPTDRMHISKDQILFWEDLKDDSTVVKAINDYKSKQQ